MVDFIWCFEYDMVFRILFCMAQQSLFAWWGEKTMSSNYVCEQNIIVDRGSKYTVSAGSLSGDKTDIKQRLTHSLSDKYFQKATHNTYAYRIKDRDGFLLEWKNDDGETWAGQCILSVLQKQNVVNVIVVVTRYFGGVQLHGDRFRHVVDATKMIVDRYMS